MNILITSPRAPIALEWAHFAQAGGHTVHFVDSLRYPLGIFAPICARYHRIPAPRQHFAAYTAAMTALIARMDIVIPTCEDIFYLAQIPLPETERRKCWQPEKTLLFQLHNKYRFFQLMPANSPIRFPDTRLITHPNQIQLDNEQRKTVLKPVYSRFGRSVIRGVNTSSLKNANLYEAKRPTPQRAWVQQQYIAGQGLCNYIICTHGKVIAHAAYRPRYLLNQSASTYFDPVQDPRLDDFVARFAAQNQYHGQAAFDFIDDGNTLWLLECNPRATSGLHLLRHQLRFNAAGRLVTTPHPPRHTALRVGASLPLLFGYTAWRRGEWTQLWQDYQRAQDVLANLPFYAQWFALGEMCYRSIRYGKPLTCASTFDIEYDGGETA